jgi:3-oxoacyl-[acyl-carrier protein] reductase
MDLCIEGKVALVSGGSRGIGLAIAEQLLREGARVVITGRSLESLELAESVLGKIAADKAFAIPADMTISDDVDHAVAEAGRRFGPVQIAISNVIGHVIDPDENGPHAGFFSSAKPADFKTEFKQLGLSAWHLAAAVLPGMKRAGWGRLINIGSGVAREPAWELPHILPNVVRPAVAGLYRCLAKELASDGITVNSILTGSIATERNRDYFVWLARERGVSVEDLHKKFYGASPIKRPGLPSEMAALAAFLCSGQASAISGQAIAMSGGTLRHIY